MERKEILDKLTAVFQDVLDDEDIVLDYNTSAKDVPGWDSLTFVMLQCEVEKVFGVKFASGERISWANIGDWVDCILRKMVS